jgi:hypothetical protein
MVKYSIITLLIVSSLFSHAIKRTVNVNIHRSVAIGIIGVSDIEVTDFGLGIITPLSRYIGINVGLCGLGLGGYDVYRPIIAGEVGFVEMLSTKYISPYSTQFLQLGFFSKEEKSDANCFLAINIGIEFFSNFTVNPFIEGGYVIGIEHWAIRGGGIRFSF